MSKNIAYKKAFAFSVLIYRICKKLKEDNKEFDISRQLLRSGTSIGANLAESNGAISKADFSNKLSIAYKEGLETKYWLELTKEVELINEDDFILAYNSADEICKILFSIIKSTRINNNN